MRISARNGIYKSEQQQLVISLIAVGLLAAYLLSLAPDDEDVDEDEGRGEPGVRLK